MSKLVRFFMLSAFFAQGGSAFAWDLFSSKISMYSCPTERAAEVCDTSCKHQGYKLEVKANPANNTVMLIGYEPNENKSGSSTLDGCRVVDSKNWVCEVNEVNEIGGWIKAKRSMTNGVYFQALDIYTPPLRSIKAKASRFVSYVCSK